MAAARGNWKSRNIRRGEWRPLSAWVERHEVVVEERVVSRGVSIEEIWREYEAARHLLTIAEAVGDERKAEMLRERVEMLENELRDAVMCDYEDFRGW